MTELDIDKLPNPYTAGAHFSPEEAELLQMGLTGVAHAAEEKGNTKMKVACLSLLERLQQYVLAGKGIPEEVAEGYAQRFQRAMVEQDHRSIIITFRKWLAAGIRMEPDPAKAISERLTELAFMSASQGSTQAGAKTLDLVRQKLVALAARYEGGDLPEDVLSYLKTWVEHGKSNLENGDDPWTGDVDIG